MRLFDGETHAFTDATVHDRPASAQPSRSVLECGLEGGGVLIRSPPFGFVRRRVRFGPSVSRRSVDRAPPGIPFEREKVVGRESEPGRRIPRDW
ncbi:hypothetical protein EA472_20705 [Natrarchaeobius oligotrophus]|uniref:Uncharacterized protein n=1 Tax=Natrarchaeobius chitinivorans TaxID=1679083 RepID=A0A3N6M6J3_NATCH|nr:hypothetical protein EA472_20705 [Natrarchaeobius chitinivorans]